MSVPPDAAPEVPPVPAPAAAPPPRRRFRWAKTVQVAVVFLLTLIASWLVGDIVDEREDRQRSVREEFARIWGPEQTVHAPLLVIPWLSADGQTRQYLKIAPETVEAKTALTPERRQRGLFSAVVYTAALDMTGSFPLPSRGTVEAMTGRGTTVLWDQAVVLLQTAGLSGMTASDRFDWNGEPHPWLSCDEAVPRSDGCQADLLAVPVALAVPGAEAGPSVPFRAALTLRGVGAFRQVLEGRQIAAAVSAPWPTPSFVGTVLPAESRVGAEGFEARWRSAEYARPPRWSTPKLAEANGARGPTIGVDLLEAVPTHRMVQRASKYAILYIALAFTIYALCELLGVARIHAIQYALLGLSMALFTLLLVSFAEPLGFGAGYALASALVVGQATVFTGGVTRHRGPTAAFGLSMTGLFIFLYVLLSLESYALLVGSVALFIVLSIIMAIVQRIDWRAEES
jgi:inner membrane protein